MGRDFMVSNGKSSCVFKGKIFCFSSSFPEDRRAEIVEWINQGGGEVVEDHMKQKVHFTVECHGGIPRSTDVHSTYVSSHRVRSCLEDGCLWDTNGHIFYSPLPCCVPLPGFENIRFCVSQYDDKDRVLLRNLCFVLGAKFVEKLTKKVTHLICKFTDGTKYEAACKWGKQCITAEWIYECVSQIFPPDCSLVGQDHSETSPIGALSNQWSKRAERKEDVGNSTTEDGTVGICDGFSETQTESQDGCLWDTNGHILYSPLPCCVPLPGFENIRFCVSQYDDKDRVLLRNLCFVLGAKFVEKLTKKVTHLICKFTDGTKFEAACKWGKQCITAEWIYECVSQTVRLLVKTIQKLLQLVLYLTSGQKELKEKKMWAILLLKMGLWAYVMALVKHKQSLRLMTVNGSCIHK
ncbi:DNA topoisomerase 2-binding protein 1-A-like isoform X3 [Cucumis sativus]|uniref:DNA topoisomerase 2-binding protein 1-A-like isoform X3 n=1 Tax=Cucumis sativus TaxID=3659 RepID=UPI0012F4D3B0|nr:DNA topoisomerase 2-binding protein 1-A-like isoform X3 [Cucumis sativus]